MTDQNPNPSQNSFMIQFSTITRFAPIVFNPSNSETIPNTTQREGPAPSVSVVEQLMQRIGMS